MKHEAHRFGFEEIAITNEKGRQVARLPIRGGVMPKGTRLPGIRAGGEIAISSAYRLLEELARQAETVKPPAWFVEYRHHSGRWLTADRGMQFRKQGIEAAKTFCANCPQYRVVVPNAAGEYVPLRRVR